MNDLNTYTPTESPSDHLNLWSPELEKATNYQINIEMLNFATYQKIAAIFNHVSVGYPKLSKFFTGEADEEIKHARMFIKYQNMRGGKVELTDIGSINVDELYKSSTPVLDSYKIALQLEKMTYVKLLELHALCDNDPQYADFIEEVLEEQLKTQQELNFKVQQLKRANSSVAEFIHATEN